MKKINLLFPLSQVVLLTSCAFQPYRPIVSSSSSSSNITYPTIPSNPSEPSSPSVPSVPSTPSSPSSEPSSTSSSKSTSSSSSRSSSSSSSSSRSSSSSSRSSSSSSSSSSTPVVTKFEKKEIKGIKVTFDEYGNPIYTPDGGSIELCYFNDSDIPYIGMWDFVENFLCYGDFYGAAAYNYQVYCDSHTFEITSEDENFDSRCFVDFDAMTITFKDRDAFRNFLTYTDCPMTGCIQGGEQYFIDPEFDYEAPSSDLVINLGDYDILGFFYNDDGYLPYEVCNALLNPYNILPNYVYNGKNFYSYDQGSWSSGYSKVYKHIRDEATCLTDEYMEFTYSLLALNFDYNYGLDKRQLRASAGTKTYFPNGALVDLIPYHDRLVSTSLNVANDALIEIGATLIDDGGHSGYFGVANFLCDREPQYTYETIGPEYQNTAMIGSYASYFRSAASKDPASLTGNHAATAAYTEQSGVAFVVFDGFEDPIDTITDSGVTASNYYYDTISLTHYANEQIRAHGIKNVVIDLSNNGGGAVYTEEFMASWLCGNATTGNTSVYRNPITGAFVKCNLKADVNLDGRYDSGDYLPSDVNVYCIVSAKSFSCGNKLPTDISVNRKTYFIGTRSGGGSCCVGEFATLLGSKVRTSADYQIGMPNSTSSSFVSNEKGVIAAFYNIGSNPYDLDLLYDWNTIINKIKAN
ncbi:MAG: S41 family peptidase [Bacilli bacterium]|nr:S41 family peptidase [Bacilli bacterium]